jgi:serine protease Do
MMLTGFGPVAEQLRRSTVQITREEKGRAEGSGFVVSHDGLIVTNWHVVSGRTRGDRLFVRLWDESFFPARLRIYSAKCDLAILQIATVGLASVSLANSNELRVGELVIAVGSPLGFAGAVSTGVVHAIGPRRGLGTMKWIHAGVQLAPGNSGGPLADARGRVVGVNTMIADGVGLAVPSRVVSTLLGKLSQAVAA